MMANGEILQRYSVWQRWHEEPLCVNLFSTFRQEFEIADLNWAGEQAFSHDMDIEKRDVFCHRELNNRPFERTR
jgi:hypothetical protein